MVVISAAAVVAVVCVAVYYDIGVAHAIAVAANVEVCKSAVVDEVGAGVIVVRLRSLPLLLPQMLVFSMPLLLLPLLSLIHLVLLPLLLLMLPLPLVSLLL